MAYIPTCCKNQYKKTGDSSKDNNGNSYIFCRKTQQMCFAQRWCPEQKKYIISERANKICKNYE